VSQTTARFDLLATPRSVGHARQLVRTLLAAWEIGDADAVDVCELVVSELLTNAVLHGQPDIELQIDRHDDLIRIAVADGSDVLPDPGHGPDASVEDILDDEDNAAQVGESGRGLLLVRAVAEDWRTEPYRNGKRVVVTVRLP